MKSLDTIIAVRGGDVMAMITIQIRMAEKIKNQTEMALRPMRLNMSTAVNMLARQIISQGAFHSKSARQKYRMQRRKRSWMRFNRGRIL